MRLGVIGSRGDPQSVAMTAAFERLGHTAVLVENDALDRALPFSFDGGTTRYGDDCVDDVLGWYVRSVPTPFVAAFRHEDKISLFNDWFVQYTQTRERASFYVSWLLQMQHRGVAMLNGPHAAAMMQSKPLQLHVLRSLGARIPKTLITNDPDQARAFHDETGDVILKPITGGAETLPLDDKTLGMLDRIKNAPVIFQERIQGDDLRIMVVGDEIVSSVAIVTPQQHLDFRTDPHYASGQAEYREVTLPAEIQKLCLDATRQCGLSLAGIDIKTGNGEYVFLELNSSPVYLEVERKLGHPITEKIARHVARRAEDATNRGGPG